MATEDAEKFLDAVDKDEKLRNAVTHSQVLVNLAKEHGFHFSNADLNNALHKKWGAPELRKGHPDPFTCCCFSETPGF